MVRVFKYHSFASQCVIPINNEPLAICANEDKVFVATSDCEIIVFHVSKGNSTELHRCPTISLVDRIIYNKCKNYIVTVELKKSWMRITTSVRVYLNWHKGTANTSKARTKVCIAGKSHAQHVSGGGSSSLLEIVEIPVDRAVSSMDVCQYSGNFAIACGSEVKLCGIVEKTMAKSEETYMDVEIFLEFCWSFPVLSISICQEFMVCCSNKEVHGIRIRYHEGDTGSLRSLRKPVNASYMFTGSRGHETSTPDNNDSASTSTVGGSPSSFISETIHFHDQHKIERSVSLVSEEQIETFRPRYGSASDINAAFKHFSNVGMLPTQKQNPRPFGQGHPIGTSLLNEHSSDSSIVEDENYVEWEFQHGGGVAGSGSVCLPGLHTATTQSQCHHHASAVSPPVLSDFSGGKVKSISGVQAETVFHLCDTGAKEDWMTVTLVPTYDGAFSASLPVRNEGTDRMKSIFNGDRTSMCCFISGNMGGYLYQLSPLLVQESVYKYTDKASQVCVSQNYLHAVTKTGIETFTSRWGAVSMDLRDKGDLVSPDTIHPPSTLEICVCGHEPFVGAVSLSVGADFLALLSKVQDPLGRDDTLWSLYILGSFSVVDQYKDMIAFAQRIQSTSSASYIHLLQEAHLLLSTSLDYTKRKDPEVVDCLHQVYRMLGDYYAMPGQEDWRFCQPYYQSSGVSLEDVVNFSLSVAQADTMNPPEFGKGLLHYLDTVLYSHHEYSALTAATCDNILKIYAVSAPEKLSRVILFSNLKELSYEKAYHHLKTWMSLKASASQEISALDKLAAIKLQLSWCEVDSACMSLKSIDTSELVDICASHPTLVHDELRVFTPLAQLMRQHMSSTLLEILVEMLDRGVVSLDSLLILLKGQPDVQLNDHAKEVLELILCDNKMLHLFEDATHMLSQTYVMRLKEKSQSATVHHQGPLAHQKFFLPVGNGHFAPRFGWLDYLAPFHDPQKILKPCHLYEVKHVSGQGQRGVSKPISVMAKQAYVESCPCSRCQENLLKLQSLLCSPRLTIELATYVLNLVEENQDDHQGKAGVKALAEDTWESVKLLCLVKLDPEKAAEEIVDKHPSIVGNFAACCFKTDVGRYWHLLRYMETVMKTLCEEQQGQTEEVYVKAYKGLLSRLTELLSPSQFLELLPEDGNLYFLIPFLCDSLNLEHTDQLKRKIVAMGKELMSHT